MSSSRVSGLYTGNSGLKERKNTPAQSRGDNTCASKPERKRRKKLVSLHNNM
jgi:hypothetical protein